MASRRFLAFEDFVCGGFHMSCNEQELISSKRKKKMSIFHNEHMKQAEGSNNKQIICFKVVAHILK
jgi:hypothetical protein